MLRNRRVATMPSRTSNVFLAGLPTDLSHFFSQRIVRRTQPRLAQRQHCRLCHRIVVRVEIPCDERHRLVGRAASNPAKQSPSTAGSESPVSTFNRNRSAPASPPFAASARTAPIRAAGSRSTSNGTTSDKRFGIARAQQSLGAHCPQLRGLIDWRPERSLQLHMLESFQIWRGLT